MFESIRVESGIFHNLEYHQLRVERSFKSLFPGSIIPDLSRLLAETPATNELQKCRILYDGKTIDISCHPYILKPLSTLKLVVDDTIDYRFKYENRSRILKNVSDKGDCDDILIVKNGLVTDTSYGNILFEMEGEWFTPAKPLLPGTQRQFILDKKVSSERIIRVDQLGDYDRFMVINSMMPFDEQRAQTMKNIYP